MNRSLLKTLLPMLMLAFASIESAIAQIPQTINYQGYLTNSASQPVNAAVNVTFRLYTAPSGGAPVWQETQSGIGVANGVFTAVLGSATPLNVPFNVPYFLSLQVNTDAEMAGRQPLSAVPYALRTAMADAISPTATLPATQITGTINFTTAAGFSGALGGDITGQQGSTTLSAIRGSAVSAAVPTDGQVLIFRGGQWQPAADVANLVASLSTLNAAVNALISPRAYVANSGTNTVTVIDTANNTVVGAPIVVGTSPINIALNPSGSRAYVTSSGTNTVSVIDTASNTVVGTIGVGGGSSIAVNPNGSRVYVVNSISNNVTVIDTATNTVVGAPIVVGTYPIAIAVNRSGSRAYVTNFNSNNVTVIDTVTNTVVGTIALGRLSPIAIALNPSGSLAYVVEINTQLLIYEVRVIDTASNTVGVTIAVGPSPNGIALNPSGDRAYVTRSNTNTVSVIDTATNTVIFTPIAVGTGPYGIALK